jgi:hypothetical protein
MTYFAQPARGNTLDVDFGVDKSSKQGGRSREAE